MSISGRNGGSEPVWRGIGSSSEPVFPDPQNLPFLAKFGVKKEVWKGGKCTEGGKQGRVEKRVFVLNVIVY